MAEHVGLEVGLERHAKHNAKQDVALLEIRSAYYEIMHRVRKFYDSYEGSQLAEQAANSLVLVVPRRGAKHPPVRVHAATLANAGPMNLTPDFRGLVWREAQAVGADGAALVPLPQATREIVARYTSKRVTR